MTYSQLSRCSTAMGSSTELVPLDPTKVKAHKFIIFTEGTPVVEMRRILKAPPANPRT